MLYCPKCQQTYEEAVQRFCSNDGSRLLHAPTKDKSFNQTTGVFTHFLNRNAETEIDKFASAPKFSKAKPTYFALSDLQSPLISQTFSIVTEPEPEIEPISTDDSKPEVDSRLLIEPEPENNFAPEIETESPISKPVPRLITPWEISGSQARLGDRKINPTGREALTWADPSVLLGQIVKGRYYIVSQIGEDDGGIVYLAEDKIVPNKKVVVRVLMDEDTEESFVNNIFAEERVSLSHVNHPNIASVIDSGELLEEKPFIITEFIEGISVEDYLRKAEKFDAVRAARVIRQSSYALSEVHQSGVLHRNLKPENIILTTTENGAEQVKLTGFGASKGKLNEENLPYKSPEQVEGKLANFASDGYSLAVIAYQMLTNRLPFSAASVGKLLKAQREGLKVEPTDLRKDLPESVNKILEKGLAFNPSDRYPKVRDFGDAFFNALSGDAALNLKEEVAGVEENPIPMPSTLLTSDAEKNEPEKSDNRDAPLITAETVSKNSDATKELTREARSSEIPKQAKASRALFSILGVAILLLGIWGIWSYFLNRPNRTGFTAKNSAETGNASNQTAGNSLSNIAPVNIAPREEVESPPLPRSIIPPPNSSYFQNSKETLTGDAMKNFLGFSLYYPNDWKLNATGNNNNDGKTKGKFIDISKNAPSGTPIEQMIVSYYDSNGTFKADTEIFAEQVRETNETLKKIIPNYEMISEGEQTVNNGWRAFEVKFQGTGKTANGEKITLWGKRLFIPTAMRGLKNGYAITMLATSLSKEVTSVDDVGAKGELAGILRTFEPNRNF